MPVKTRAANQIVTQGAAIVVLRAGVVFETPTSRTATRSALVPRLNSPTNANREADMPTNASREADMPAPLSRIAVY